MTEAEKQIVRDLRKQGLSYREIAEKTGVNRGSISKLFAKPAKRRSAAETDDWGRDAYLVSSGNIKRAAGWNGHGY